MWRAIARLFNVSLFHQDWFYIENLLFTSALYRVCLQSEQRLITAASQHRLKGFEKHFDVHFKTEAVYVFKLTFLSFAAFVCKGISSGHLPETRDTGSYRQKKLSVFSEKVRFFKGQRTGADHTHLTGKDVKQLRELVNAELSDEFADRSYSRIVLHFILGEKLFHLVTRKIFVKIVRIVSHGTELYNFKGISMLSYSLLQIKGIVKVGKINYK